MKAGLRKFFSITAALMAVVVVTTSGAYCKELRLKVEPVESGSLIYVGIDIAVVEVSPSIDWAHLDRARRILTQQKTVQAGIGQPLPDGKYCMAFRMLYTITGEEEDVIIGGVDNGRNGWVIVDGSEFEVDSGREEGGDSGGSTDPDDDNKDDSKEEGGGNEAAGEEPDGDIKVKRYFLKPEFYLKNPGGFIYGYPDQYFNAEKEITRAEFIAMLDRLVGKGDSRTFQYADVSAEHWAHHNILNWSVECRKISKGKSFQPEQVMKRDEIAAVLESVFDLYQYDGRSTPFSDVGESPYAMAVNQLGEAGIMTGFSGKFFPEKGITRAEAVALLQRLFASDKHLKENIFKDVMPGDWYYEEILQAIYMAG